MADEIIVENYPDFVESVAEVINTIKSTDFTCRRNTNKYEITHEEKHNRLSIFVEHKSRKTNSTYNLEIEIWVNGTIEMTLPHELETYVKNNEQTIRSTHNFSRFKYIDKKRRARAAYNASNRNSFPNAFNDFYKMLCTL